MTGAGAPIPDVLPVLPLHDTVVLPFTIAPILVGQERSVQLVEDAAPAGRLIALVTQREGTRRPARPEDLHRVGVAARIHQTVSLAGGLRIIVQGLERVRLRDFLRADPYPVASVEIAPDVALESMEVEALLRAARDAFLRLVAVHPELPDELGTAVQSISEPRQLTYTMAASAPLTTAMRQEILELDPMSAKLRRLTAFLQHELGVQELVHKIAAETSAEIAREQREQILRRHLRSIQRELGEAEPEQAEAEELRDRLARLTLPDEARREVDRELERLRRTPMASPEHGVIRTFLDWIVKLPWGRLTGGPIDLERARQVLDEDHYDLDRVKDRIVEYLAVKRLRAEREAAAAPAPPRPGDETRREPILCFVGPPGVGKTSLGQSIARAMGRRFVRISLGGIHDEAEIRGHRRTYIGAMPGRILQALARGDAADPVFMLDEVDKLGVGFHGDPSAALLEVLDPAQNHSFTDTYLGLPFDLSRVLFITTANTTDTIPPALLDRMEVLRLAGYTDSEKLFIARRFLLPRLLAAHGLRTDEITLDDDVLRRVIRDYTREAGVRNLEREVATLLRKAARRIGEGAAVPIRIAPEELPRHLGPQRFFDEVAERIDRPGVAAGLAWTPTGGEVLFVEAAMMPAARERLILTGMLGNVMRESAQAALSYLRSHAEELGVAPRAFQRKAVHVHVPAGAIPKDGPSAGLAILAALASQASGRPVRTDVAMTGEVTLRGKVLPVGGIKEKVLAAHRAGLTTIVLPRRNEGALADVPEEARSACRFVLVESCDEALVAALEPATARPREVSAPPPSPRLHRRRRALVGRARRPTFMSMQRRSLNVIDAGHVANCSATDCLHNRERACVAPGGIQIVLHRDHADCGTYTQSGHRTE